MALLRGNMNPIFDFSSFPVLTTERLRLRQLTHADAEGMIAIFGASEVLRFLNLPVVDTRDKAIGMIDWLNERYHSHESVNWAVILREDDRLIGQCGTHNWDRQDRHVDIGYHIEPSHWGRGYATEAAHAIIRWCFDHYDVHRVQADCTDGNLASERVLLKCGFKVEGLWRESCWEHGRFVDIKQFGLLRREYDLA
jgi:ribosomal-protein-alanine N-acetyltransferase